MRKIREILRLRFGYHCSYEAIARSIGIGSSTVSDCVARAKKALLNWPLPDDLTDVQLEEHLYPVASQKIFKEQGGAIDWTRVHKELKRKHMTLLLLWEEHKQRNPQGIGYSQFCYLYRAWRGHLDVWMRQDHKAGERLFVDYAGQTMPVLLDSGTGEVGDAQIFVAAFGASDFTYVEATWTQTLPDWISSHVNAFEYFGGCPEIVTPDCLKSGVKKTHLYEPEINPTYQDMAMHYSVVVIPARSGKARDKAKVENAVQQVERRILAKLRDRLFMSLHELNSALKPLLDELNRRPFQKIPGNRLSLFEEIDKPVLKPLPEQRYSYAEWKKVKAGLNYHVEIEKHFYSVPYTLSKKELFARYNTKTVEIFCEGTRVASHVRSYTAHRYTTLSLHMPPHHQAQIEWTPERISTWARKSGPATQKLVETLMAAYAHPQQAFRSCIGIIRLGKSYGEGRLESACKRALHIGSHSYKSIESILKNKLDATPLTSSSDSEKSMSASHEYIRGKDYFK